VSISGETADRLQGALIGLHDADYQLRNVGIAGEAVVVALAAAYVEAHHAAQEAIAAAQVEHHIPEGR
jgi:hypothetical protein